MYEDLMRLKDKRNGYANHTKWDVTCILTGILSVVYTTDAIYGIQGDHLTCSHYRPKLLYQAQYRTSEQGAAFRKESR